MNKYQQATTFYNHYVRLSDSKKEEFSRLCNKLLSYNYICASRPKDQDDYYKIVSELDLYVHPELLKNYSFILMKDGQEILPDEIIEEGGEGYIIFDHIDEDDEFEIIIKESA